MSDYVTDSEAYTFARTFIEEMQKKGREALGEHARYEDGVLDGLGETLALFTSYLLDLQGADYDLKTVTALALFMEPMFKAAIDVRAEQRGPE